MRTDILQLKDYRKQIDVRGEPESSSGADTAVLRSSLAVRFVDPVGKQRDEWLPSPRQSQSLDTAFRARRSTVIAYGELFYALRNGLARDIPNDVSNRELLSLASRSRKDSALSDAARAYRSFLPLIDLMVHGSLEIRELASGEIQFAFYNFGKRISLTVGELIAEAHRFGRFVMQIPDRCRRP